MNKNIQGTLLWIAGGFLALQTLILTLSPIVRERTFNTEVFWTQWIVIIVWGGLAFIVFREINNHLPESDPYIFPIATLLSGWGVLTIWRLEDDFGARQTLWFAVSLLVLIAGFRISSLSFLQRYKYILLVGGLGLTGLTLFFGTNPGGFGPRLWLGCCNVYFQPSEPLKLLLIIYLSAYLAEKLPYNFKTIHIIYPTLVLGGMVILLLVAQRDLGTASIFLVLYTFMIFVATNRNSVLVASIFALMLVGVAGYYFIGIVQSRVDLWLNPWADPSGRSYQIIQGLLAIANGGIEGRGHGLGSPELVPVVVSDFIYVAIAEETGLFGTLGLLALFGILLSRGIHIALQATDVFKRFLATGISIYFGVQTILIVGGNLRLLPLTGVTLPFVSYGGSSLLTSFMALLLLLLISDRQDQEPALLKKSGPYATVNLLLLLGLFVCALATGWWAVVRGPDLLVRNDNLRRVIEERYVPRGAILDRSNKLITTTTGNTGKYERKYVYSQLAPVVGYNDPYYGQAGLEASLDGYLRGTEGNPAWLIWVNQLLYGMTPNGLGVRLSTDLDLQSQADELMQGKSGAVVLINAESGEILAMASHPTFDANQLDQNADELLADPQKPLINRAALGLYPIGSAIEPFAKIFYHKTTISQDELRSIQDAFNFFQAPELRMDTAQPTEENGVNELHVSPLQMALAAAGLSNDGILPAPRIALAVNTPQSGWVILPALGKPIEAVQSSAVNEALMSYIGEGENFWSHTGTAEEKDSHVTWFIGGTPPNWQASPLAVVVLLEESDEKEAQRIGQELLHDAMGP